MNKQANLAFKETYTSEVMNEKMDSGDRIYRKGEAYHRRESKVRTDWSGSAKGLVRVIINLARIGVGMVLGFSLAGTSLFQRFFPFGPAYTGVWISSGLPGGILVLLAMTIGFSQSFPISGLLARLGSCLFLFCLNRVSKAKPGFGLYGSILLLLSGLIGYWAILGFRDKPLVLHLVELTMTVAVFFALRSGMIGIFAQNRDYQVQGLRYSLGLVVILFYLGLSEVFSRFGGAWIDPALVFGLLMISLLTVYCGLGAGSALAIAFALADALTTRFTPWNMMLLTGSGLAGGIGRELLRWKKPGYALGFLGNLVLVYAVWPQSSGEKMIISSLMAIGIFLLIPITLGKKSVYKLLDLEEYGLFGEKAENIKEVLFKRLYGITNLFTEMAKVFTDEDLKREIKPTLNFMMEEIAANSCGKCDSFHRCWQDFFYSTYKEVFDLISLVDLRGQAGEADLKGRLREECLNRERLLAVINHQTELYKVEYMWKKRFNEARSFLSAQLQGVSGIIIRLTQQINLDIGHQTELEYELFKALTRMGFTVTDLSLAFLSRNNVEIQITKKNCGSKQECRSIIAPLVAQLLGGGYSVQKRQCKFGEDGSCRFSLKKARRYKLRSAAGAIPKAGNELCGDSYRLIVSDEGYSAAILSDGMGVGKEASKLSKMTISLMERLMAAGLDKRVALQLVNSILLLRNAEENFATLDLFVVDHYTGEGEFIKIGAASTYFKRGQSVDVIRSTSLPVGILNSVEPEYFRYSLQDQDFIIMVTDGFLGFNEDQDGDWILKALKTIDSISPQALCGYLMELARIRAENPIDDDMSVIVLQIVNEDIFD